MLLIIICAILTSNVNSLACVHDDGITPNEQPCDCGSSKTTTSDYKFCYKWSESGNEYSLIGRSDSPANFEIYYKLDAVSADQVLAGAVDSDAFCNKLDLFTTIMSPNQCKDAGVLLYPNMEFTKKTNDNGYPVGCSYAILENKVIWNVGQQFLGMHVDSGGNDAISRKAVSTDNTCICGKLFIILKNNTFKTSCQSNGIFFFCFFFN